MPNTQKSLKACTLNLSSLCCCWIFFQYFKLCYRILEPRISRIFTFLILFRDRLEFSFCRRHLLVNKNISKRRKIQSASLQRFLCVWHSSISIFIVWSIVTLFFLAVSQPNGFLYSYCDCFYFFILPKIYQDSLRFKDWCLDVSLALQCSLRLLN